ncbi:hypothetical protein CEXT_237531 [Caerostris extrusa]|uniref:Uncharacterized protein n=1 Tax=Caerostris extrusa TaxID=172846 RepID=A0AAV4Y6M9_CAEEX|nr:hypothetical protein CEXT_237531 [Caerostris extrusa]
MRQDTKCTQDFISTRSRILPPRVGSPNFRPISASHLSAFLEHTSLDCLSGRHRIERMFRTGFRNTGVSFEQDKVQIPRPTSASSLECVLNTGLNRLSDDLEPEWTARSGFRTYCRKFCHHVSGVQIPVPHRLFLNAGLDYLSGRHGMKKKARFGFRNTLVYH